MRDLDEGPITTEGLEDFSVEGAVKVGESQAMLDHIGELREQARRDVPVPTTEILDAMHTLAQDVVCLHSAMQSVAAHLHATAKPRIHRVGDDS